MYALGHMFLGLRRKVTRPMRHPRFRLWLEGDVVRMVCAQTAVGVLGSALAGMFAGWNALLSALTGAVAYILPNAVFALRLLLGLATGRASAMTFFAGQLIKVALSVAALVLAAWLGAAWLVWPALLWGLCCALMGYMFLPALAILQRKWSK